VAVGVSLTVRSWLTDRSVNRRTGGTNHTLPGRSQTTPRPRDSPASLPQFPRTEADDVAWGRDGAAVSTVLANSIGANAPSAPPSSCPSATATDRPSRPTPNQGYWLPRSRGLAREHPRRHNQRVQAAADRR